MSKKDYIQFAAMLKGQKPVTQDVLSYDENQRLLYQWQKIVLGVVSVFAADNPRFDRERFLSACGYNQE